MPRRRDQSIFQRFIESEAAGGLVLMASAALGMVIANSPLADDYLHFLHWKIAGLDVLHWINDGLMALFFLLVGLEIKRELLVGELTIGPAAPSLHGRVGRYDDTGADLLRGELANARELAGMAIPTATTSPLRSVCCPC